MSFIFNPQQGETPRGLADKRAIAMALMQARGNPRNLGEGLGEIGNALAFHFMQNKIGSGEADLKNQAATAFSPIVDALRGSNSPMGTSVGTPSQYIKKTTQMADTPASANPTLDPLQKSYTQQPQTTTEITGAPGIIADELKKAGYAPHQIAGALGNFQQESSFNPGAINPNDPGGSVGFGQWNRDRKQNLVNFANQMGGDPADPHVQAKFIVHELQTSEKGAGDALRNANDVQGATAAMIGYERPQGWTPQNPTGGHGWNNRLRYAQGFSGADNATVQPASFQQQQGGTSGLDSLDVGTIMQIASDQNVMSNPMMAGVVNTLLEHKLKSSDPMAQMQAQKLQIELQNLQHPDQVPLGPLDAANLAKTQRETSLLGQPKPAEPYTMQPGEIRYDSNNKPVATGGPTQKAPTVETAYDEQGRAHKVQWNPETKQWDNLGGSEIKSGMKMTTPDGTVIEMGGNGTGAGGKQTEADHKAELLTGQLGSSIKDAMDNWDAVSTMRASALNAIPGGRIGMSKEAQIGLDGINNVVANWLYITSGATATPQETARQVQMITPTYADQPEARMRKKERFQEMIDALNTRTGRPKLDQQKTGPVTIDGYTIEEVQ
jgi:hypothetical protein